MQRFFAPVSAFLFIRQGQRKHKRNALASGILDLNISVMTPHYHLRHRQPQTHATDIARKIITLLLEMREKRGFGVFRNRRTIVAYVKKRFVLLKTRLDRHGKFFGRGVEFQSVPDNIADGLFEHTHIHADRKRYFARTKDLVNLRPARIGAGNIENVLQLLVEINGLVLKFVAPRLQVRRQ